MYYLDVLTTKEREKLATTKYKDALTNLVSKHFLIRKLSSYRFMHF